MVLLTATNMYGYSFLWVTVVFGLFCVTLCAEIDDHPAWNYLPNRVCGYGASSDRIVGGKTASLGQFPWMARLGYVPLRMKLFTVYLCSGSVISKWYIITAAHCFVGNNGDISYYSVRLGENHIGSTRDCENNVCAPPVQDINVKEVIPYDKYVEEGSSSYGDIALIKLAKAIQFNDYVQPICVPSQTLLKALAKFFIPYQRKMTMEVAGWGMTDSVSQNIAQKLMYAKMPLVDLDSCRASFYPNKIDESQLCVGDGEGVDSCTGDSGGPLMKVVPMVNGPPKYFIFGIVSYGMKLCGISAAVYTNVTYYLKWILDHIQQ